VRRRRRFAGARRETNAAAKNGQLQCRRARAQSESLHQPIRANRTPNWKICRVGCPREGVHELREKSEKEQRGFGVQQIDENALSENVEKPAPRRWRLAEVAHRREGKCELPR